MADREVTPKTFAAGLSEKALHCRELGHVWRSWTVAYDKAARAYDRRLRCTSCKTVRKQMLDSAGHVLANSYQYPDGYLAKGVEMGARRDVYRLEAINRILEKDGSRPRAV